MPPQVPIYDLTLLLSMNASDDERAKIVADVESAISSGAGSVERNDDWGTRAMTYRIDHQSDAEYHLLQFSGPTSLLDSLSHSLRINDNVLRFRIIKVLPGQPPAPDSPPPVMAAATAAAAASAPRASVDNAPSEPPAAAIAAEPASAE
jgi:small subunit ribosomal protein S6